MSTNSIGFIDQHGQPSRKGTEQGVMAKWRRAAPYVTVALGSVAFVGSVGAMLTTAFGAAKPSTLLAASSPLLFVTSLLSCAVVAGGIQVMRKNRLKWRNNWQPSPS